MALQEKQLGQLRPANTTAASLYSPAASTTAILRTLHVSNTTASSAKYRLFVDDDGTTYDETTAIAFDITLPANTTDTHEFHVAMNNSTGNFAVRTDTANALTFSLHGVEIT